MAEEEHSGVHSIEHHLKKWWPLLLIGGGGLILLLIVRGRSSSGGTTVVPQAALSPASTSSTSPVSSGLGANGSGGSGYGGYGGYATGSPTSTTSTSGSSTAAASALIGWLKTHSGGSYPSGSNPGGVEIPASTLPSSQLSTPSGHRQAKNIQEAIAASRAGFKVVGRDNTTGQTFTFNPGSGTTPSGASLFVPKSYSTGVVPSTSGSRYHPRLVTPSGTTQASSIQDAIGAYRSGKVVYARNNKTGQITRFRPGSGKTPAGASLFIK